MPSSSFQAGQPEADSGHGLAGDYRPPVALPLGGDTVLRNPRPSSVDVAVVGGAITVGGVSSGPSQPGSPAVDEGDLIRRLFPPQGEPGQRPPQPTDVGGIELDHFRLLRRIGLGGMGAVFLAEDQRLRRMVALKVLGPWTVRDQTTILRFQNEARAAARLNSSYIARVYYAGESMGLHFIAFEFVPGMNLRDLIRERGRIEINESLVYAIQLVSALRHMTAAGVVHRDIKPSNIIIGDGQLAKLVDLGLARHGGDDAAPELTVAGTTLGTFDYISPEQAKDPRSVDVRSDIYSLGCTLYHMLTGEPPYPEGTVLQKLLDHQADKSPDPSLKNRRVPPAVSAIVRRMMASDPRRRYPNPEELLRDLCAVAVQVGVRRVPGESSLSGYRAGRWQTFVQANLGWVATAAALVTIVFLLDRFYPQIHARMKWAENPSSGSWVDASNVKGANSPQTNGSATGTSGPGAANGAVQTSRAEPVSETGARTPATDRGTPATTNESTATAASGVGRSTPASRTEAETATKTGSQGASTGDASTQSVASVDAAPRADGTRSDGTRSVDGASRPGATTSKTISSEPGVIAATGANSALVAGAAEPLSNAGVAIARNDLPGNLAATDAGTAISDPAGVDPRASDSSNSGATSAGGNGSIPGASGTGATSPGASTTGGGIVISGSQRGKTYSSLEAACREANDGDEIELRFDGVRLERKSIRLDHKRLTIVAGRGFKPIIEFRPEPTGTDAGHSRMLSVVGGSLSLRNIDFRLRLPETSAAADRWTLFSLNRAEQLQLTQVQIAILNPRRLSACVVELSPPAGQSLGMGMMKRGTSASQDVTIAESFIVAGGDLICQHDAAPARITLSGSVIGIDGTMLHCQPQVAGMPAAGATVLNMSHNTAVLGGALCEVSAEGSTTARPLPLEVTAENNIITVAKSRALIEMRGELDRTEFLSLLQWNGNRNFFDAVKVFWLIDSRQETSPLVMNHDSWRSQWSLQQQLGSENGPILWKQRTDRPAPAELTRAAVELEDSRQNAAAHGASDGTSVGARLTVLPSRPHPLDLAAGEKVRG